MRTTHISKQSAVVLLLSAFVLVAIILAFPIEVRAAVEKVDICHVTNIPNPGDGRVISIAIPAWPAHEAHGDKKLDDPDVTVGEDSATCHVSSAPVVLDAADDEVTTPVDTPVTIDVLANDRYVGEVLVSLQIGPSHGLVGPWTNGTITYYPDPGFFGTDSFTYQICETESQCDTATVIVIVGP